MRKKCTQKRNLHVYPQLIHALLLMVVLGAPVVDMPICICVLLSKEWSQQKVAPRVPTQPVVFQKSVEIPATVVAVVSEVAVVPASCEESKLVEVPAEDTKPVTVTPVAITPVAVTTVASFPEKEENKTNPSATEPLDRAVKAVVAAKKASTEAEFLAKLEEAKKLTLQIKALTKSNTTVGNIRALNIFILRRSA